MHVLQDQLAEIYPDAGDQMEFPFAWSPWYIAKFADKRMVKRRDVWGEIVVYRNTTFGIWVVSKWIPVIGPSGRIGAAMYYVFPELFFSGREAHRFAHQLNQRSGPLIDQTFQ